MDNRKRQTRRPPTDLLARLNVLVVKSKGKYWSFLPELGITVRDKGTEECCLAELREKAKTVLEQMPRKEVKNLSNSNFFARKIPEDIESLVENYEELYRIKLDITK